MAQCWKYAFSEFFSKILELILNYIMWQEVRVSIFFNQFDILESCQLCKLIKEQGIYHCSKCDICVRGYDHHCPWVENAQEKPIQSNSRCSFFHCYFFSLAIQFQQ
ncbi:unnamed protein product [Paramecium pentaurelia]|uniref:Palmitoyltransferase n=1 Tax=Paramecium pentaurelia TaxID=43138 RepID=A0A8S1YIY1_9CILI|nr:unnamed protein product [Paramecium pentaurelia]